MCQACSHFSMCWRSQVLLKRTKSVSLLLGPYFFFQMLFVYFDFQWFDSHFPIHPMSDIDEIMKMFYYLDMKISIRKPHDKTKRIIVLCLLMPKWIVYIAKCASHFPSNRVHKNSSNACWFGFFFFICLNAHFSWFFYGLF